VSKLLVCGDAISDKGNGSAAEFSMLYDVIGGVLL